MLYSCTTAHMTTVGVKVLNRACLLPLVVTSDQEHSHTDNVIRPPSTLGEYHNTYRYCQITSLHFIPSPAAQFSVNFATSPFPLSVYCQG